MRGRWTALALTLASAVIVVTCGAGREHLPPAAAPSPAPPSDTAAAALLPSAAAGAAPPLEAPHALPAESAPEPAQEPPPARGPGHELDSFYAALRGLERHTRTEHARVVWLGDSHGASDFWSGALRSALQKRFGNGGLGFVHIGNRGYRHDGVKLEAAGAWKLHPRGPSSAIPQGDGVYGLSGILMSSESGGQAASVSLGDAVAPLPPALRWDVCYKLTTARDEITIHLDGDKPVTVRASAAEPPGALRHVVLTSNGAPATLRVAPASSTAELCGVVVEADPRAHPGVVLDTLGINGARLTTPLAWDEASWTSELSRRAPALVILEYGTNEASDLIVKPDQFTTNLAKLMARVRRAAPSADCMVLAPTERADKSERMPLVRDALKAAARVVGCGFWDTYEAMGGKGSILAWRAEAPPRAAADGIHLTMRGYRELGDKLAADILNAFSP